MIVHLTDTKAALMAIAAVAGGAISQAFGGWDAALATLIAFMAEAQTQMDAVLAKISQGMSL